jgi:hypothetical protein
MGRACAGLALFSMCCSGQLLERLADCDHWEFVGRAIHLSNRRLESAIPWLNDVRCHNLIGAGDEVMTLRGWTVCGKTQCKSHRFVITVKNRKYSMGSEFKF